MLTPSIRTFLVGGERTRRRKGRNMGRISALCFECCPWSSWRRFPGKNLSHSTLRRAERRSNRVASAQPRLKFVRPQVRHSLSVRTEDRHIQRKASEEVWSTLSGKTIVPGRLCVCMETQLLPLSCRGESPSQRRELVQADRCCIQIGVTGFPALLSENLTICTMRQGLCFAGSLSGVDR